MDMIYKVFDENGDLANTIVAPPEFVEEHYPGRYELVGEAGSQEPPLPPVITKVAFRFRLTDAEYVAILTASKTDVAVEAWVSTFNMVSQVNLSDERTVAGLNVLVSEGLLTQERATEILSAIVLEGERP
jgi:hypothetical protein